MIGYDNGCAAQIDDGWMVGCAAVSNGPFFVKLHFFSWGNLSFSTTNQFASSAVCCSKHCGQRKTRLQDWKVIFIYIFDKVYN
jgi:hypothetical protein